MQRAEDYRNEQLDHLGIVAWNLRLLPAIGFGFLVGCSGPQQQRGVSYGTATVAMISIAMIRVMLA